MTWRSEESNRGERCRAIQGVISDLLEYGEVVPTLAEVMRVLVIMNPSMQEYETAVLGAGAVGEAWEGMTPSQRAAQNRAPTSEELQISEWLNQWPAESRAGEVRRLALAPAERSKR